MSGRKYPTIIHERVDLARKGKNPTVICRLRSGWVVLGDDQRLRGYSLLLADPEPLMYHGEVVHRDGVAVGYVRAASYGHTLGGAVGLAMVEAGEPLGRVWLEAGSWEVDVAGERHPAVVSLSPLYDPSMERVRA